MNNEINERTLKECDDDLFPNIMRSSRYAPQSLQWAVNVKEVRVL